jgi:hypothetical protein
VQGRDYGNLQVLQELNDKTAPLAAEYAVFVLQTDDIWIPQVQKTGCETILVQSILANLKPHRGRILIALETIIDGDDRAVDIRIVVKDRGGEVGSECSDATLPWKVCADKRN